MKTIANYENYSVTEDGRVFNNKTGRELKGACTGDGYRQICLRKDNGRNLHYVHRLVAQAYILNPDNKPQVNHKDMDKANNHISNLEWCTHQENVQHAWDNGRVVSDEDRRKMSESRKGRPAHNKGKKVSDETRRKMSEARKGKKHKKFSDETRLKMSEAKRNMSDETRRKMSESRKGKKRGKYNKKYTSPD